MSSQNAGATPTVSSGINQPATTQCVPVRGPDRTRRAGSTRPIPRLVAWTTGGYQSSRAATPGRINWALGTQPRQSVD